MHPQCKAQLAAVLLVVVVEVEEQPRDAIKAQFKELMMDVADVQRETQGLAGCTNDELVVLKPHRVVVTHGRPRRSSPRQPCVPRARCSCSLAGSPRTPATAARPSELP